MPALRAFRYILPVATMPGGTDSTGTELTGTAAATFGQLGTWEYVRCGTIAFDTAEQLPEGWSLKHALAFMVQVPVLHRCAVELYDTTNSLSLGHGYFVNYPYGWPGWSPATKPVAIIVRDASSYQGANGLAYNTGFLTTNLPSADARLILRYYLDKTSNGSSFVSGTDSAYFHGGCWWVERSP